MVLIGNFNESLKGDSGGIARLAERCDLMDVMSHVHGNCEIPTQVNSKKRIDFALATPRATNAIMHCGYEPFTHYLNTNHRAMFIDFDTTCLFINDTLDLPPMSGRDITFTCPKQVTHYLEHMGTLIKSCNILERTINLLECPVPNHVQAEPLDRDLLQFALATDKACKNIPRTPMVCPLSQTLN